MPKVMSNNGVSEMLEDTFAEPSCFFDEGASMLHRCQLVEKY